MLLKSVVINHTIIIDSLLLIGNIIYELLAGQQQKIYAKLKHIEVLKYNLCGLVKYRQGFVWVVVAVVGEVGFFFIFADEDDVDGGTLQISGGYERQIEDVKGLPEWNMNQTGQGEIIIQ